MVRPSVDLMSTWTTLEMIAARQAKTCAPVRAKRSIRTIDRRAPRVCGKTGNADFKRRRLLAEHALQPAHEPYRHALYLPRSKILPQPSGVFPVLYLCIGAFGHCRRSEQEIKRYLWAGRLHFVDCRLSRRVRSSLDADRKRHAPSGHGPDPTRHLDSSTAASTRSPAQARDGDGVSGSPARRGLQGISPPKGGRGRERRSDIEDLGDTIHDDAQILSAGVPQSLVSEARQHGHQA